MEVQVSLPLAFGAGFVSFLSACILPVVPGYLAFVTAVALDELAGGTTAAARRWSLTHGSLFMVGFGLVFLSLGLVPTAAGPPIARALPWMQRLGGVLVAVYGAHLLGALRRVGMRPLPQGVAHAVRGTGAAAVGAAFGAGWTPCIGPVLGSILLYVSFGDTMAHGVILLLTYALGLSVPFVLVGGGLTWPLAGSTTVGRWAAALRRAAGGILVVLGVALAVGWFARLTAFLAGLGQLINLELG